MDCDNLTADEATLASKKLPICPFIDYEAEETGNSHESDDSEVAVSSLRKSTHSKSISMEQFISTCTVLVLKRKIKSLTSIKKDLDDWCGNSKAKLFCTKALYSSGRWKLNLSPKPVSFLVAGIQTN